jgi:hydroxymethylpyrimidine pyrophosphatase-like HAD family hydrolase
MRFHALACDYDGTIARDGRVPPEVVEALRRVRESGRRVLLVTGRQVDDLLSVFPDVDVFDRIVAENGAVLYDPATQQGLALADPPPPDFDERLRAKGVAPLARGHVIVATWRPHETVVLDTIRELGLELQVIFNKDAVMVLPSGVNKATGLAYALRQLHLSPHNTVGVGDAENDHAFLALCEASVAVANALPAIKERADWTTAAGHGPGVLELIDALGGSDLENLAPILTRHHVPLGTLEDGTELRVSPYGENLLFAGTSGSGKSTLTTAFVEALADRGYQFCIIDPEGDYEQLALAVTLGDQKRAPTIDEVMDLLTSPEQNLVVNLIGLPMGDRPAFFAALLPRLQELRTRSGRPHWVVVDEAHHLLPDTWDKTGLTLPLDMQGLLLVTVHPEHVSRTILGAVQRIVAIGESLDATIRGFAERTGQETPPVEPTSLPAGEALTWAPSVGAAPSRIRTPVPRTERRRHLRKYAQGELDPERSFYFEGPAGKLHLRAQNLQLFLQMADGVDDETWMHHLHRGDYSRWFREAIKDDSLADEAAAIEAEPGADPQESRQRIRALVEERYTAPA